MKIQTGKSNRNYTEIEEKSLDINIDIKRESPVEILKIFNHDIFLRDMIREDIENYVVWNTTEREWEEWDAPWEKRR